MKCPVDGSELKIAERQGIEIDYCPQCRGVWLDRGELDKIIERAASYEAPRPPAGQERSTSYDPGYDRYDDDDNRHHNRGYPPAKRKRSFLGEVFDIFD
jgi:hypothetical protein